MSLRDQQTAYEELRFREKSRLKRLEQREQDVQKERVAIIKQSMINVREEKDVEQRVCVSTYSSSLLGNLLGATLTILKEDGFIRDEFKLEMENVFLPWLNEAVDANVSNCFCSRMILDGKVEGN